MLLIMTNSPAYAQLIHQLSTPVTNILLNTQLALDICQQKHDQSNLSHYLSQSLMASKYLQSILKQPQAQQRLFNLSKTLNETLNLCQFSAKYQQIIRYFHIDEKIKIRGNVFCFQQALICLINNAFEAYSDKTPHKMVIISARVTTETCYLSITDGGLGMSWLQQKFASVKGISYKSNHTGLGLAYAKKIFCTQMHGKMKILSKENRGTTISIDLPIKT